MILARNVRSNLWAFSENGADIASVWLPSGIVNEVEALAWWAEHGHTLAPNYVDPNAAWDALRAERDRRLADCDWTQLADAPVDAAAWAVYRQALRDLPGNTADPSAPIWPAPPEEPT